MGCVDMLLFLNDYCKTEIYKILSSSDSYFRVFKNRFCMYCSSVIGKENTGICF